MEAGIYLYILYSLFKGDTIVAIWCNGWSFGKVNFYCTGLSPTGHICTETPYVTLMILQWVTEKLTPLLCVGRTQPGGELPVRTRGEGLWLRSSGLHRCRWLGELPLLQVFSVIVLSVIITEQSRGWGRGLEGIYFSHKETKRIPTKFWVKEGANGNVILLHFDGVDRWICRWFCKVFDE